MDVKKKIRLLKVVQYGSTVVKKDTGIPPRDWAKHVTKHGAGEIFLILLTLMALEKDMMNLLLKNFVKQSLPVITGGIFRYFNS